MVPGSLRKSGVGWAWKAGADLCQGQSLVKAAVAVGRTMTSGTCEQFTDCNVNMQARPPNERTLQ